MENNNRNNFEVKNKCLLNAFTENCGIVHEGYQISIPNNDFTNLSEILIDSVNGKFIKEDTNKKIIITEEQTELYKDISQHLLEKGLINFTDNTPIKDYKVYKPENSPAPNWKKINFNKKRYKR